MIDHRIVLSLSPRDALSPSPIQQHESLHPKPHQTIIPRKGMVGSNIQSSVHSCTINELIAIVQFRSMANSGTSLQLTLILTSRTTSTFVSSPPLPQKYGNRYQRTYQPFVHCLKKDINPYFTNANYSIQTPKIEISSFRQLHLSLRLPLPNTIPNFLL